MIETEKATDKLDLPHDYEEVKMIQQECVCGRKKDHQLHQPMSTEQASHSAVLQTEKGT